MDDERFDELINRSSLGSTGARELRDRTPVERARAMPLIAALQAEIDQAATREEAENAAADLDRVLCALGVRTLRRTPPAAAAGAQPAAPGLEDRAAPKPARDITDLAPAYRLALRNHPVVNAIIISDLLVQALDLAVDRARGVDLDVVLDRARDLTRALTRARARDADLDRALDRDRDRDLAVNLTHALDRALPFALDLALNLAHILVRDLALDRVLDRVLVRDVGLDVGLERARDLARAITHILVRARNLDRDLDHLAVARAHDLARNIDRDLVRARNLDRDLANWLGMQLGLVHVEGLAVVLLSGALDDFTRADLTYTDLTGVNLSGVRWSEEGTRWPKGTDLEQLRRISHKISPDSGIYVIGPGDGGKRTAVTHQ